MKLQSAAMRVTLIRAMEALVIMNVRSFQQSAQLPVTDCVDSAQREEATLSELQQDQVAYLKHLREMSPARWYLRLLLQRLALLATHMADRL